MEYKTWLQFLLVVLTTAGCVTTPTTRTSDVDDNDDVDDTAVADTDSQAESDR